MSYRVSNHTMRREIRSKIMESCERLEKPLQNHFVEDLITKRCEQIGKDTAIGSESAPNWDKMVSEAWTRQVTPQNSQVIGTHKEPK